MKPKQIIILAIILGVLVTAVIFQKTRKPPELQTQTYSTLNFNFDASNASQIVVQKNAAEKLVELSKEEGVWRVVNFLNVSADQQKIDNFLKQVQDIKGELRAKDKSLFSDFKIGDEEAVQIIISGQNGEVFSHLFVGSKQAGGNASFIRRAESEDVYYAQINLFGALGFYGDPEKDVPKRDFWVSLKPLDLKADQLEQLEIRRLSGGKEVVSASVIRETDPEDSSKKKWKYTRSDVPFGLDAEKVKQFLTTTSNWYASKALDPNEKDYGFSKPTAQVRLMVEGQKEVILTAVQESEGSNSIFVQISGEPAAYEYSSSFLKHLNADDSKFFVSNPLAIENAEKIEKLTIKTPNQNLVFTPKEKKWDSLTNYINNDLKNVGIKRLFFDSAEQKKAQSGRYFLEIVKEGGVLVRLYVGDALAGKEKEYAAQLKNNTQPFTVSEATFKILFDNLDRLAEPK
jgi:hypothetical protein